MILGFLGLCAFFLGKTGYLKTLSHRYYHDCNDDAYHECLLASALNASSDDECEKFRECELPEEFESQYLTSWNVQMHSKFRSGCVR